MTTQVERIYDIDASVDEVWSYIANDAIRAEAISFVKRFESDGDEMIWHLGLPLRALPGTVRVRTRDVERREPEYVRFVGSSRIMDVQGEHELSPIDGGCRVTNTFVVDGHFPGVERFFKQNIDSEIDRLVRTVADRVRADRSA